MPSEFIDISITSNANSFVACLGVDQSVLVLKKGNDIEESSVVEELKLYNKAEKLESSVPWLQGRSDFKSSDIVIITNAKKEYGK